MSALAAFLERLDLAALDGGAEPDMDRLVEDAAINEAGERLGPTFERYAERAGIDLSELISEVRERIDPLAPIMRQRVNAASSDTEEEAEIALLGVASAVQFFLAGALWEQERHLPDLDAGPGWDGES